MFVSDISRLYPCSHTYNYGRIELQDLHDSMLHLTARRFVKGSPVDEFRCHTRTSRQIDISLPSLRSLTFANQRAARRFHIVKRELEKFSGARSCFPSFWIICLLFSIPRCLRECFDICEHKTLEQELQSAWAFASIFEQSNIS